MTLNSQIVQQNLYNFPNYGVEGIDSRRTTGGPTHRLRNYSRAATTWAFLLYESFVAGIELRGNR